LSNFQNDPSSLKRWLERLGSLKEIRLKYALCHQFLQLIIEGDELYTIVTKNKPPAESIGVTIVLMDRASRFICSSRCFDTETALFENAMATLAQVIEQTDEIELLTDFERRYSNLLLDRSQEVIRTGQVGRPKTTRTKGVKVRVIHGGSQTHKKGPKRPKYQSPKPSPPETKSNLENQQIHANHSEHLIVLYGFDSPRIKGKLIPTPSIKSFYKRDLMHFGSYTTLFDIMKP
jgi:hypothetical protein